MCDLHPEKTKYLYPSGSVVVGTDTAAVMAGGKPLQDVRMVMAGPKRGAGIETVRFKIVP